MLMKHVALINSVLLALGFLTLCSAIVTYMADLLLSDCSASVTAVWIAGCL